MKFKDLAQKVKATVAPSNADRYAKARKLQEENKSMQQKVRSLEAVAKQQTERRKLQERAQKAKEEMKPTWMKQDKPSSQKISKAHQWGCSDPFEALNSTLLPGQAKSTAQKKGKKQEADFPDFNFL